MLCTHSWTLSVLDALPGLRIKGVVINIRRCVIAPFTQSKTLKTQTLRSLAHETSRVQNEGKIEENSDFQDNSL